MTYEETLGPDEASHGMLAIHRNSQTATLSRVYLTSEIGEASGYTSLMQELLQAEETDRIELWINSPGGYVSTTVQLIEAIKASSAKVVAVLCGECHSGASFIALSCDEVCVLESASMLVHTSSGGFIGKNSDTIKSAEFHNKYMNRLLERSYAGFMTEDEIAKLQEGQDFWFDAEEIQNRLLQRNELAEAEMEKLQDEELENKTQEELEELERSIREEINRLQSD